MVFEHAPAHASQWGTITSIAEKIGCWRGRPSVMPVSDPATTDERASLKQLKRENFEQRRANEILKKASAYFAQAELDRRAK